MIKKSLIAVLLLLSSTTLFAQTDFTPAGISGGGSLYGPVINPHNGKIFLICDMGDFFSSTDKGESWEMVNFQEISPDLQSSPQFTSDPNTLYAIHYEFKTVNHHVAKSTDNGVTWTLVPTDPADGNTAALFVNPAKTNEFIIAGTEDIFYTNDGGQSYSIAYTATGNDVPLYVAGGFWSGNDVFVGTKQGLLVSTNNGASFTLDNASGIPSGKGFFDFEGARSGGVTRLFGVVANKSSLDDTFLDDTDLAGNNQVIQMDFGSTNWTQSLKLTDMKFYRLATVPDNIDLAYVSADFAGGEGRIFKTSNGGSNWTNTLQTANNQNITTGWAGDGSDYGWSWSGYGKGVAIDANDPDFVVVSDWGFVHTSEDGGANWQQAYVGRSNQNNPGSEVDSDAAYINNGLMLTTSWNITWFSPEKIFIGYTDITGWRSIDGGNSWLDNDANNEYNTTYEIINHPTNDTKHAGVSEVHDLFTRYQLTDDDTEGAGDGALLYSNDDAATWNLLKDFGATVIDVDIDPNNTEVMYASVVHTTHGGVYKTSNLSAGTNATWTKLPSPAGTEGHPYVLNILDDGALVVSYSGRIVNDEFTPSSGIFYSNDGGQTWENRSHSDMIYWTKDVVVDPHDENQNTWYACVQDGETALTTGKNGLFRTTNRGQSWTKILTDYNPESVTIDPVSSDKMYVTTEYSGLLITENLHDVSPTFSLVNSYPFFHPLRVEYNPYNQNEIWVTSFGNGVYKASLSATRNSSDDFGDLNGFNIYPNPANGFIQLGGGFHGTATVQIYDLAGRRVYQKDNVTFSDKIDISALSQGMYFVKINDGIQIITSKFIKID